MRRFSHFIVRMKRWNPQNDKTPLEWFSMELRENRQENPTISRECMRIIENDAKKEYAINRI